MSDCRLDYIELLQQEVSKNPDVSDADTTVASVRHRRSAASRGR